MNSLEYFPISMAAVATASYSEHQSHHDSNHYDTDGDEVSTTITYQSGYSSDYRHHDLSRLSRHNIKIRSSSSFPNLLSLYQSPIREESNLDEEQAPKKKKAGKRQRKQKDTKTSEYDDPLERRTRQEVRQLRVDAVAREQVDKFDNYVRTMQEKVEKQREDRRKYNEILHERLREQEEAEKQKLRLHRGPKHVYVHDTRYQKTLPVSNYCKATRLADELQRKGVLRTRGDVEKYWSNYANNQRTGVDIFSDTESSAVNNPQKWMTTRRPEIKVTDDDEDAETVTEAVDLHHRQLPPIKKKKKKKRPVI